jgi:hypothetical protein
VGHCDQRAVLVEFGLIELGTVDPFEQGHFDVLVRAGFEVFGDPDNAFHYLTVEQRRVVDRDEPTLFDRDLVDGNGITLGRLIVEVHRCFGVLIGVTVRRDRTDTGDQRHRD